METCEEINMKNGLIHDRRTVTAEMTCASPFSNWKWSFWSSFNTLDELFSRYHSFKIAEIIERSQLNLSLHSERILPADNVNAGFHNSFERSVLEVFFFSQSIFYGTAVCDCLRFVLKYNLVWFLTRDDTLDAHTEWILLIFGSGKFVCVHSNCWA